jgi:hypothetical protein
LPYLDSTIAIQPRIAREIDHTHPAAAELARDGVGADLLHRICLHGIRIPQVSMNCSEIQWIRPEQRRSAEQGT